MEDKQRKGLKILVIGETCSGKSTVAHLISEMLEEHSIHTEMVDDIDGVPMTLQSSTIRPATWDEPSRSDKIYLALKDRKITIEQLQVCREPTCTTNDYGDKEWYLDGQLHREDGPALEWADGFKEWYLNGQLHRTDGPAIEYANGDKSWFLNGKPHREDGPASEWADGNKYWYLDGNLHRGDGPAIEYPDGTKRWYLNGKELTEAEHAAATKPTCDQKTVVIDGLTYKLILEK